MTTKPTITTTQPDNYVRLPDAPKPEDMNNFKYLHLPGNTHHLAEHLGNPDTTIVSGEAYISREPTGEQRGLLAPDLLIACNVNPEAGVERNGYVISEQGKPPDFVLEIASPSAGRRDATTKREGYAALGIPEYWLFDHSGGQHIVRFSDERERAEAERARANAAGARVRELEAELRRRETP